MYGECELFFVAVFLQCIQYNTVLNTASFPRSSPSSVCFFYCHCVGIKLLYSIRYFFASTSDNFALVRIGNKQSEPIQMTVTVAHDSSWERRVPGGW